jgi:hypothetical protein
MKGFWYLYSFTFFFFCCSKTTIDNNDNTEEQSINTEITFVKTLGGSNNDVANAIVKTTNNGYAVLGYTQSNNGDITTKTKENFDVFLLNFNQNDELIFTNTFGGLEDDRGNAIIQTNDNGFAILGYSSSENETISNNGSRDFWMIKTNSNGNLIWQKNFGFAGNDTGISIIQTNDNGFLLTGIIDVTASEGQGNAKKRISKKHAGGDFWAIKLSGNGDFEWSKFFGGSFTDTPLDVVETQNNSFIIVGSSDSKDVDISNNLGSYDFWVIHISAKGELIWEKNFGGSEIDEAYGIAKTADNNFVIVGDTRSSDKNISKNNGGADVWLIKIDINGNLLWEKTIGASGFDASRSIKLTADNGFLITGSSRSSDNDFINKGQNDALLIKVDENGDLVWQKTVGGSKIDLFYDAVQTKENEYIAVGESSSSDNDIDTNKGFSDLLIVKITE